MKQNLYSLCSQPGGNSWRLRFNFTYSYIDDILCINNPEFENYLGQMYPVELEIKDTTESNTSAFLPGFTSVDREGRSTSHFHLWQTWRFQFPHHKFSVPWVAIFQPRPPMASLFRSLYGMPGLAPRMNALSWGRRDFQISYSNRDTSGNAWNRHWGSFMVDTGSYQTIWSFPHTNVKWHSVTWSYTMTTPYWSDFVPNSTFYRILSGFHRTFATGVACRQETLTPQDTWSRPFGTCICSTCWDQSFSELVVILPDYALRISLGTFSILLQYRIKFFQRKNLSIIIAFRKQNRRSWICNTDFYWISASGSLIAQDQ